MPALLRLCSEISFADNDVVFKNEASPNHLQIPENTLADGEKYRWYVRAFNKAGWVIDLSIFTLRLIFQRMDRRPPLWPRLCISARSSHFSAQPVFRWKSIQQSRSMAYTSASIHTAR
jgi:hypothetical protein